LVSWGGVVGGCDVVLGVVEYGLKMKPVSFMFVRWGDGVASSFVSVCGGVLGRGGLHVLFGLVSLVLVGAVIGTDSGTAVGGVCLELLFVRVRMDLRFSWGVCFLNWGRNCDLF
jgi:hypothetical protein